MASYQVGASCFSTALSAAQAAAASQIGSVVSIGSATYVIDVTAVTGASITYKLQNVASTASVTKVAAFTPLPCGLVDTSDGLVIAWGVATAWLLTAAVMHLRRGIHE